MRSQASSTSATARCIRRSTTHSMNWGMASKMKKAAKRYHVPPCRLNIIWRACHTIKRQGYNALRLATGAPLMPGWPTTRRELSHVRMRPNQAQSTSFARRTARNWAQVGAQRSSSQTTTSKQHMSLMAFNTPTFSTGGTI